MDANELTKTQKRMERLEKIDNLPEALQEYDRIRREGPAAAEGRLWLLIRKLAGLE